MVRWHFLSYIITVLSSYVLHWFWLVVVYIYDEGKGWLDPSRDKNQGTHRRKQVDEKSCVTFLLCDPRLVRPTNLMSRMNGKKTHTHTHMYYNVFVCLKFFWCPCMAIIASLSYNDGLLLDIILLIQCYYHRGTRLNATTRFRLCSL